MTGLDAANDYTMIEFDIAWDNSWRTSSGPSNWDASWVFVKWQINGGAWSHCTLNTTNGNHTAPSGTTIDAASDGTGVFIYRSVDGSGSNDWVNAQLRWEYGTDGVVDDATVTVKVFAIEMVYIPQGSFYVGSGGNEDGHFYEYPTTTNEYQITSEEAITVGTTSGNLYYPLRTYGGDQSGPIPADYPKGYSAFYIQKYGISQGQYADFLNMLTTTQQGNRTATMTSSKYVMTNTSTVSYRNGLYTSDGSAIVCDYDDDGTGDESNDGENIACNYLSWADGTAYADWAGLRPFTSLEFEKACRGTEGPVANEYAWGNANIAESAYTLSNSGVNTEGIATNYGTGSIGNASYETTDGSIDGPLRCGVFAAHASNSGRINAGASFYGAMELSGNLWERHITVGNTTGRSFTGVHGNGALTTDGDADVTNWPSSNATGTGWRGGAWSNGSTYLSVSDRGQSTRTDAGRQDDCGFRASRTQ